MTLPSCWLSYFYHELGACSLSCGLLLLRTLFSTNSKAAIKFQPLTNTKQTRNLKEQQHGDCAENPDILSK